MSARHITVDGVVYGWRVTERPQAGAHITKLLAFREGTTDSALRLTFADGPTGTRVDMHGHVALAERVINLNRPVVVEAVIRCALSRGWSTEPMSIDDGFPFLASAVTDAEDVG